MTIKETAGRILLYFYQLQRTVPSSLQQRQVGFIDKKSGGVAMTSDKKWLTNDLQDINPASLDIFNAFAFLADKGYIGFRERVATGTKIYIGVHPTADGIDVIEGIEGGDEGRRMFTKTFNMEVADTLDVETFIKEKLGKLLN